MKTDESHQNNMTALCSWEEKSDSPIHLFYYEYIVFALDAFHFKLCIFFGLDFKRKYILESQFGRNQT